MGWRGRRCMSGWPGMPAAGVWRGWRTGRRGRCRARRGQRAGTLSGGTRQKLSLTLALMHDPPVLFLDEPYQGFDWQTYLAFWDLAAELRAAGTATVVISHLVFEQERFDRICHLTRAGFAPRKTGAGET
jgi:ABC-type multidrug transport system ATPase subunit